MKNYQLPQAHNNCKCLCHRSLGIKHVIQCCSPTKRKNMSISKLKFEPGTYLAYELSDKTRAMLLTKFKPSFSKVVCHHVTIEFNLTAEKLEQYIKKFSDVSKLRIIGEAHGDGIECLAVGIDLLIGLETKRSDGSFYHITLSLEPPHKPVESNKLESEIHIIRENLMIEGEFKLLRK